MPNENILLQQIRDLLKAGSGLPSGAATSANQSTQITAEQAILAKLTSDPATQTTLAAILAKIIAAPATEATLAAISTLLGTTGIKILKQQGAANSPTSQVTASTSAATLVAARATRRGLLIRNTDAAINVYVGPATVTSSNGMLLKPGESVPVTGVGLWQVIADSGAPVIAILDEYD